MARCGREPVGIMMRLSISGTTRARVVPMALNVKDEEAVRLAGEVAAITGESKTRAIRVALQERLSRLERRGNETPTQRRARLLRFLEEDIWPLIPKDQRGKPPDKKERERILGYGEHGYSDH